MITNNKINKLTKDNYKNKWYIDNKMSMTFCKINVKNVR